MAVLQKSAPPGATSLFFGDWRAPRWAGWFRCQTGRTNKYYVTPPEELGITVTLHFADPPTTHLGQPITDDSIENLGRLYIDYLSSLVDEAEAEFGGS